MTETTRRQATIAITTYQRPESLRRLLDVVLQHLHNASARLDASILVVDNDPAESGRQVTGNYAAEPVRYVAEAQPGIAAARQRALDEVPQGSLLIYLDDDVIPCQAWLEPLLDVWDANAATIVVGYVRYTFPEGTDPWIVQGGFMHRTARPTGTHLNVAAAGNILVDVDAVRRLNVVFDRSLGLSGGEDSLFTTLVARNGGIIIWCQESVVDSNIPENRATRAFCMARARAHGSVAVLVALKLSSSPFGRVGVRIESLLGGLLRTGGGFAKHLIGRLSLDVHSDADGMRIALRGLGMACAAIGFTTLEYRRTIPARSSH